jgi:fibronectin type 3 domain-containing protein
VAMNVDPDGMADLALVQAGSMRWLRTIERSSAPAQMVLSSDFPYTGSDKAAPSTPTGLKATPSAGRTISLNWTGSTDNSGGIVFYRVYRNGRAVGTRQTTTTYVDHPAKAGWYAYTVKAIDGVGNTSAASNKVTVKAVN